MIDRLREIAEDVLAGHVRRAKVRTLMSWYGLKRRREAGLSIIRADMTSLGIDTEPPFESAPFDDQVRFVPLGQGVLALDEPIGREPPGDAIVEAEPFLIGARRFRVLLRSIDAVDRLRERITEERLARILATGQNPRREDRDAYPFFLRVEVGEEVSGDEVEAWAGDAASLEGSVPAEELPVAEPRAEADWDEIKRHTTDLHEALRSEFSREMEALRFAVEQQVEDIRLEALRKLAKELNDEEAMRTIEEFQAELDGRMRTLQEERDGLAAQVSLLTAQLEDAAEPMDFDPQDAYPTLEAAVRLFRDLAEGDAVVVHDAAIKSASRSATTRRREVLRFLMTLRELGESLRLSNGGIGTDLRTWFRDRGYDYSQGDGQTTSGKFGHEREVQVGDRRVRLEEHVTLFPNTRDCVTVYFLREPGRPLVVGYVGPHLRTASRG